RWCVYGLRSSAHGHRVRSRAHSAAKAGRGRDTWYIDLVSVEQTGSTFGFRDMYIDVMVPEDGRHYLLLDRDEFAHAIDGGVLRTKQATDALRRWQRFLDRHLHSERAPSKTWADFPPASIRPLVDLQLFEEVACAKRVPGAG